MTALPSTSFICRKLNATTFLIIEDDAYDEQPYIYVKLYADHILITDTGCNAPRRQGLQTTCLRDFIDNYPLPNNEFRPLNPGGEKKYVIICSHCHYDRILGLSGFSSANPSIIASAFNPNFVLQDLPARSLCRSIGALIPQYTISIWVKHRDYIKAEEDTVRLIQFLHVPGHTPDSLAWYDYDERYLYVGDFFYKRTRDMPIPYLERTSTPSRGAIIVPKEGGSLIDYFTSLEELLKFVRDRNMPCPQDRRVPRVKVGCGHFTHAGDAERMITQLITLVECIIKLKVDVVEIKVIRGVYYDVYLENEDAPFCFAVPRSLLSDARAHFHLKWEYDLTPFDKSPVTASSLRRRVEYGNRPRSAICSSPFWFYRVSE